MARRRGKQNAGQALQGSFGYPPQTSKPLYPPYPEELSPLPWAEQPPPYQPAPPAQTWPPPPYEADYQQPWPEPWQPPVEPQAPARPRARKAPYVLLFLLSVLMMLGMVYFVMASARPYADFQQQRAFLSRDTFYEGVVVDGVPLGGLSMQEAAARVQATGVERDKALNLQINIDGRQYAITSEQLPFDRNVQAVLESAYALGRQGFPWMLNSDKTPFQVRYEHTQHTAQNKAYLSTAGSYDKQQLRALVMQIDAQLEREPRDAMIQSFDFRTKAFTVTQDEKGASFDEQALFLRLSEALDAGRLSEQIVMNTAPILPRITSVELQNSFMMLSSFSTEATKDTKRNTNIELAANAITGHTVMPDEEFSFNQVVGERTAQKGYQMAPAIAGGVTFDEIGGGVCQVSSTLFNAAAMADMQIVKRSPHAWPSSYVEKGRDATVNWPNLDFSFRNTKSTPVFIVASFAGRRLMVEIYGLRTHPGESIQLRTQLVSTTEPPRDPIYQINASLAPGTQKELKKPRTGYLVETYRVYLRGGTPYHEEKLFNSNYRMVQQVIEYN